jgi:hypothetical protein
VVAFIHTMATASWEHCLTSVRALQAIRSFPMVDDEQQPLVGTEPFAEQLLEGCKRALAGKMKCPVNSVIRSISSELHRPVSVRIP